MLAIFIAIAIAQYIAMQFIVFHPCAHTSPKKTILLPALIVRCCNPQLKRNQMTGNNYINNNDEESRGIDSTEGKNNEDGEIDVPCEENGFSHGDHNDEEVVTCPCQTRSTHHQERQREGVSSSLGNGNVEFQEDVPFAEGVFVVDPDDPPPRVAVANIPTVEAVCHYDGDEENNGAETVRLDSSHIVSIRSEENSNDRPEFASVILVNRASYADFDHRNGILGIGLQRIGNGELCISRMDSSSPFSQTAMKLGDILISINSTTCKGMDPDATLSTLLFSICSRNRTTTVRLRNVGGLSSRVVTSVEKCDPNAKLGISFGLNARNSVIISTVSTEGPLVNSLLSPRDRVICINDTDCSTVSFSADNVAQLIREASRFVTIVAETTMDTGVVIAIGSERPTNNPNRSARNVTVATNQPEERSANGGACPKTCASIFVFFLVVTLISVISSGISRSSNKNDYAYPTPTYPTPTYPTPTFPTYPTYPIPTSGACEEAILLETDGTPVRDSLVSAPRYISECSTQSQMSAGRWFTFFAFEDEFMEICTCNDVAASSVLTVYQGDCQAHQLDCLYSNGNMDDIQFRRSSALHFPAMAFQRYYVLVQGVHGFLGGYSIKVEASNGGETCDCESFIFSAAPSASVYPSWVSSATPSST